MSRILKRPMFRKGGSPNKGIMTGLVDRKQYGNGTDIDKEKLKSNTQLFESILRESSPKTRLPIGEFGLNLASGMTLTDALKTPYARFTKADDAREAAISGGASKLAIAQALKKPTDQFKILSADEAKLKLPEGTYNPKVLYQQNIATGKIEGKSFGPKEVIRDAGDPYAKRLDEKAADSDVARIEGAEKNYLQANKLDQTIGVLSTLADTSDEELRTGTLGPLRLSATKLLNELGVDVDFQNVPLAELLNAVGGKVAIQALQGFKGAISNKELDFVVSINPGLATSKDGIKLQLALLQKANNINKKYYTEVITPFVDKNKGLRGTLDGKSFRQLQTEFYEKNPYLTPDIQNQISSVQNQVDPEYSKNIVVKNGVRYLIIPSTKEVLILPNVEEK
jgi:hypothetical protein